jgi:hypothetical protein
MGNPIPIQERSVDPYSSYNSDVVNKLTRIVSDGKNTLLMPSPIYVEIVDNTHVMAKAGKAIMDDVLIEIEDLSVDMTDGSFYLNVGTGTWDESGYYYVVLDYQYNKISPPPEASIKLIKPSQRGSLYDPLLHLFISAIYVTNPGGGYEVNAIFEYDPDNPSIAREAVGGGSPGTTVVYTELASGNHEATTNDDTIVIDTSLGNATIILPLASTSERMIRIVKLTPDANTITIEAYPGDSIEGNAYKVLSNQYDAISIIPYPTNNVWIEV